MVKSIKECRISQFNPVISIVQESANARNEFASHRRVCGYSASN